MGLKLPGKLVQIEELWVHRFWLPNVWSGDQRSELLIDVPDAPEGHTWRLTISGTHVTVFGAGSHRGPGWLPIDPLHLFLASSVPEEEQKLPEADIAVFHTFLKQQAPILGQYPLLLPQQAANQPPDSPLCHQAPKLSQRWHLQRMLRWLNKPHTMGGQQR